jgi:hypothetical protein
MPAKSRKMKMATNPFSRIFLFLIPAIAISISIAAIAFIAINRFGEASSVLSGLSVAIYKPPQCPCCSEYASYLSSLGARVEVAAIDNIDGFMDRLGVPQDLRSCHISIVEGYIVVGHVPAEAIKKLLSERPNIKGISLPGMPPGSPGMPGTKEKPFVIYSFNGSIDLFLVI